MKHTGRTRYLQYLTRQQDRIDGETVSDQDPIERFYRQLSEAGLITEEERQQIEQRVDAEVEEAAEFADKSPEPDPKGLFEFLYIDPPANVV